jgi:tetratricopeptide (TPR) repeat protein
VSLSGWQIKTYKPYEDFAMRTLTCLAIIGMLGIALLMGDSAPTLGSEQPGISPVQVPGAKPLTYEAFTLQPLIGFADAERQISWSKQHIPTNGEERSFRLSQLTRLYFFLGEAGYEEARKSNYEKGRSYANLLIKEQPLRVEGYYWLALNLCGLASVSRAQVGLTLLPRIVELLETSLLINRSYDQAGAHRVLGRIYFKAPCWPLSVGDYQESLRHLALAVKIAPKNSTNHLFYAETLYCMGKRAEAQRELEKVLTVPQHALWPKGLEDDRQRAQELIKEYNPTMNVARQLESSIERMRCPRWPK